MNSVPTMQKLDANDPVTHSADLIAANVEHLKSIFPEAFVEGKIDFDVLRQLLGGSLDGREEKYGLNWHGKSRARQLALTPSTGTLRPIVKDSVDWETTQNLLLEGDNLEVLKLLQKSYAGRIKLIYIDPPYNTGKDFVYSDNFADSIGSYLELTGQTSGGSKVTSNAESSGRFHTDWLNMMYARLRLARNLLRVDGTLFISIDEREYAHLRTICCEIFGEENLMGTVVWKNATDNNPTNVATEHEYLLVVAKAKDALNAEWKSETSDIKAILERIGADLTSRLAGEELRDAYQAWFREHKSELGPLDRYKYIDEGGIYTGSQSVHNPGREGYRYDVIHPVTKRPCKQPLMGYRFPQETLNSMIAAGRVLFGEDETKIIELKVYASEYKDKLSSVLELDGRLGPYDLKEDFSKDGKVFSNPKPVRLLSMLFSYLLRDNGDIILDFFAGSGTSAVAAWSLNSQDDVRRRFIAVQLPEPLTPTDSEQRAAADLCDALQVPRNIAELTKERLRRAGARLKGRNPLFAGDLGFRVFKLDSSNVNAWAPNRDNLEQTLLEHEVHIRADRTEADVLYELLLKLGLDLCVPIQERIVHGMSVYSVAGGVLFACLAPRIDRDSVELLAQDLIAWRQSLNPAGETTCVFRDSAFADDVTKSNLAAILTQNGLTTVRSV